LEICEKKERAEARCREQEVILKERLERIRKLELEIFDVRK